MTAIIDLVEDAEFADRWIDVMRMRSASRRLPSLAGASSPARSQCAPLSRAEPPHHFRDHILDECLIHNLLTAELEEGRVNASLRLVPTGQLSD